MKTNAIARVAALIGEPARTAMLMALMDGRALTALELARAGHVTPQTASRHLAQLTEAGLLAVSVQGRHRYHRLASPEVARLLEGLMQLAAPARDAAPARTGPRDEALRAVRTCYDHLAGRLGVAIAARLVDDGSLDLDSDAGHLTARGHRALRALGLSADALDPSASRRIFCRPCLDWSERRPHLAGRLGALLCAHCLAQGWLRKQTGTRALTMTPSGVTALRAWLGLKRWERAGLG